MSIKIHSEGNRTGSVLFLQQYFIVIVSQLFTTSTISAPILHCFISKVKILVSQVRQSTIYETMHISTKYALFQLEYESVQWKLLTFILQSFLDIHGYIIVWVSVSTRDFLHHIEPLQYRTKFITDFIFQAINTFQSLTSPRQ